MEQKQSLQEVVNELAGQKYVDCGTVPTLNDPSVVDSCVVASFRTRRPFVAVYEIQGIDSSVANVYVGNRHKVYKLYDSDPCGGGNCGPHIEKHLCLAQRS